MLTSNNVRNKFTNEWGEYLKIKKENKNKRLKKKRHYSTPLNKKAAFLVKAAFFILPFICKSLWPKFMIAGTQYSKASSDIYNKIRTLNTFNGYGSLAEDNINCPYGTGCHFP